MNNERPRPDAPAPGCRRTTLEALRREAEENRNKYLRAAAELDNFRKRSAREVENGPQIRRRAPRPGHPAGARQPRGGSRRGREGRRRRPCSRAKRRRCGCWTRRSRAAGIREIIPKGEPFDPNEHEALSLLAGEPTSTPNTVLEVIQKGYRDQRPAAAGGQGDRRGPRATERLELKRPSPHLGVTYRH